METKDIEIREIILFSLNLNNWCNFTFTISDQQIELNEKDKILIYKSIINA
jgi:hypothetical protein